MPAAEGGGAARAAAFRAGHLEAAAHLRAEMPEAPGTAPDDFTPYRTPGQGN